MKEKNRKGYYIEATIEREWNNTNFKQKLYVPPDKSEKQIVVDYVKRVCGPGYYSPLGSIRKV